MSTSVLSEVKGNVGVVIINRPEVVNALNNEVVASIIATLKGFDADNSIGCMVVTGDERAFAAGADISDMQRLSFIEVQQADYTTRDWRGFLQIRKPIIAAVSGFALGGGCELAMMCDMIYAAENAQFGQPEVLLGLLPGAGGTQRLPRAIGKAKAMDMVLTGHRLDAKAAERAGLVARIFPNEELMVQTLKIAQGIAEKSMPVVRMIKESVNRAYESSLTEGLLFERRVFHATFALTDPKEGMRAFIEKRSPHFKHH